MKAIFETEMAPGTLVTLEVEHLGKPVDSVTVFTLVEESSLGIEQKRIVISLNGREARQLVGTLQAMIG